MRILFLWCILKRDHMIIGHGRRPECKNGAGCRYLAQKRCAFFHPAEHLFPKKPTTTKYVSYEKIQQVSVEMPTILTGTVKWFFLKNKHYQHKSEIKNLKYKQCSICFMEYEQDKDNTPVTQLYCGHNFHKDCLEKWLRCGMDCPMCKHDFRDHQEYAKFDPNYKEKIEKAYRVTASLDWDDIPSAQDYGGYQQEEQETQRPPRADRPPPRVFIVQ